MLDAAAVGKTSLDGAGETMRMSGSGDDDGDDDDGGDAVQRIPLRY